MANKKQTARRAKRAPASSNATEPKPASDSRRRLFTALGVAATAAIPTRWARPVVKSVLLPAHAASSPDDPDPAPSPCDCEITSIQFSPSAIPTVTVFGMNCEFANVFIDDQAVLVLSSGANFVTVDATGFAQPDSTHQLRVQCVFCDCESEYTVPMLVP